MEMLIFVRRTKNSITEIVFFFHCCQSIHFHDTPVLYHDAENRKLNYCVITNVMEFSARLREASHYSLH